MLATELSPYSLVPVNLHTMAAELPATQCVNIMNDICKIPLVTRAAIKDPQTQRDLSTIQYIFDEVDTRVNPMTSRAEHTFHMRSW
jgi:hypothetical protein